MRFVFPVIAIVWGAGIVLNFAVAGPEGNAAYGTGQTIAAVFGGVLFVAGLVALRRRLAATERAARLRGG